MTVLIRRALPADAAALTAAFRAAYEPMMKTIPDMPDVAGGLDQDITDHIVWIAEDGGDCLGGLVLGLAGDTAHLINVATTPAARGKGIGRQMMETAQTHARAAGATRINLATHKDMGQNVFLYERLGYSVTGTKGTKVEMSKPL